VCLETTPQPSQLDSYFIQAYRNFEEHPQNSFHACYGLYILTMQRPTYGNQGPANSPPLHHPVPQHVSTVPQLRSPPPPAPQQQQQSGYGNPYQPQAQGGNNAFGAYGQFMTDPTAQMGFQVGQTALKHGTEYVEQNVGYK
jgi:hypothetical protein